MARPNIYPPRTSLHLKVSFEVMQALTKYKLVNGVSLNRAVDDLLRSSLQVSDTKIKIKIGKSNAK